MHPLMINYQFKSMEEEESIEEKKAAATVVSIAQFRQALMSWSNLFVFFVYV